MYKIQIFLIFVLNFVLINAKGEDDLIKSLPGVDFEVKFKQYSGYLNAGNNGNWKFFYWSVLKFFRRKFDFLKKKVGKNKDFLVENFLL